MRIRQLSLDDYDGFVDKFKPKKTTDDCYTPPEVFEEVRSWACERYGLEGKPIVRPFQPDGDYENYDYPDDCVVLDNPPFSILSRIVRFYQANHIPFFLFAPSLTNFSSSTTGLCHIIAWATIEYDNGATVNTSFLTNLEPDTVIASAPDLHDRIERASDAARERRVSERNAGLTVAQKRARAKSSYEYPPELVTAAMLGRLSVNGVEFSIPATEAGFVRALDAQRPLGKAIFGGGYLTSERVAAARREADLQAERNREARRREAGQVADIRLELSGRERAMVAGFDQGA